MATMRGTAHELDPSCLHALRVHYFNRQRVLLEEVHEAGIKYTAAALSNFLQTGRVRRRGLHSFLKEKALTIIEANPEIVNAPQPERHRRRPIPELTEEEVQKFEVFIRQETHQKREELEEIRRFVDAYTVHLGEGVTVPTITPAVDLVLRGVALELDAVTEETETIRLTVLERLKGDAKKHAASMIARMIRFTLCAPMRLRQAMFAAALYGVFGLPPESASDVAILIGRDDEEYPGATNSEQPSE